MKIPRKVIFCENNCTKRGSLLTIDICAANLFVRQSLVEGGQAVIRRIPDFHAFARGRIRPDDGHHALAFRGSILLNFFSDKFSASNFGPSSTQKQH
jgi:hypothetical protein